MPRNPDRIPLVLAAVQELWTKHPDWRLGQLISNLADHRDVFNLEDDELLKRIDKRLKEGWK